MRRRQVRPANGDLGRTAIDAALDVRSAAILARCVVQGDMGHASASPTSALTPPSGLVLALSLLDPQLGTRRPQASTTKGNWIGGIHEPGPLAGHRLGSADHPTTFRWHRLC